MATPTYTAAYVSRGLSNHNLKDYRSAQPGFTKGIELQPEDAKAYNNRGLVRHGLRDFSGAIRRMPRCRGFLQTGRS